MFGARGVFLRKYGGHGNGPGEFFGNPLNVSETDGTSISIYDGGANNVTTMNLRLRLMIDDRTLGDRTIGDERFRDRTIRDLGSAPGAWRFLRVGVARRGGLRVLSNRADA